MKNIDTYNLLFEKIRLGDQESYNILYNQFYTPLYMYALRYVDQKQWAEDCVQEVFLKLWRDKDSVQLITEIRSYLLVSVRNTCLNMINKHKLHQTYEQYMLATYDPFDVSDLYSIEELTILIEETILNFSEKQQNIFRMSRFDGLKNMEIANELGISIKTVEASITKSLKTLSLKLQKYYFICF